MRVRRLSWDEPAPGEVLDQLVADAEAELAEAEVDTP